MAEKNRITPTDRLRINGVERSRVVNGKELRELGEGAEEFMQTEVYKRLKGAQPSTREDCRAGERPCPYISCKYHLYLDVDPNTGSVKFNFPNLEVWEIPETCSLDVADRDGATLEEVAGIYNLTRERIRQFEREVRERMSEQL